MLGLRRNDYIFIKAKQCICVVREVFCILTVMMLYIYTCNKMSLNQMSDTHTHTSKTGEIWTGSVGCVNVKSHIILCFYINFKTCLNPYLPYYVIIWKNTIREKKGKGIIFLCQSLQFHGRGSRSLGKVVDKKMLRHCRN